MTIASSGSLTSTEIRAELRQTGGNIVVPDPTTRWLSEIPSVAVAWPTDFYDKSAIKVVDDYAFSGISDSRTAQFGIDFPGRTIIVIVTAYRAAASQVNVSSLSVAGVPVAAPIDNRFATGVIGLSGAIASAGSPVGTTGNITVNFVNSATNARIIVLSVANVSVFSGDGVIGFGVNTLSLNTLDPTTNSIFLLLAVTNNGPQQFTFTGANEIIDSASGTLRTGLAFVNRLPPETNRPSSVSWVGTSFAILTGAILGG